MAFPANLEELRKSYSDMMSTSNDLYDESTELERKSVLLKNLSEHLRLLADSWKQDDYGKYGGACFFLDSKSNRVVVREFLEPNVLVFKNEKEWREAEAESREKNGSELRRGTYIPYWLEVVELKDVQRKSCPRCKSEQPVVEWYCQTFDSPDGDVWQKIWYVICFDCNSLTEIERKERGMRF